MAASNITNMEEKERIEWMETLDVQKDESLIRFIFGISQSNENIIKSTAEMFLHIASLHCTSIGQIGTGYPSYMYANFFCEMETAVPMCEQIIAATLPRPLSFTDFSSRECFRAAEILLKHSLEIDVAFCDFGACTDSMKELMRRLRNASSVNEVTLEAGNDMDLNECLVLLGAGEEDSCVRRVTIKFQRKDIENCQVLPIGVKMDSWKLMGGRNSDKRIPEERCWATVDFSALGGLP
jgi:hypothetical protein